MIPNEEKSTFETPGWAEKIGLAKPLNENSLELRSEEHIWQAQTTQAALPKDQLRAGLDSLPRYHKPLNEQSDSPPQVTVEEHSSPFSLIINNNSFPTPQKESDQSIPKSRIEELYYQADGLTRGQPLKQYGYDFFSSHKQPKEQGPVAQDYRLGPTDELIIQVSGPIEINETFSLDREGTLFLPNFGNLNLLAKKLEEATDIIEKVIGAEYLDFTLNVSLGKIHSIRLLMVGFANQPGLIELPSTAGLLDALFAAGGIQKDGSLRNLELIRDDTIVTKIDLYELLLSGSLSEEPLLHNGDRIRIPPIGPTTVLLGPSGSGIYELKDEVTIDDLVGYVGGINAFTFTDQLLLERTIDASRRDIRRLNYRKDASLTILKDGDAVQFSEVVGDLNHSVLLSGEIVRPGLYPFEEGMHVSDLVERGKGFLIDASLQKALIERRVGATGIFDLMPDDQRGLNDVAIIWVDLEGILNGNMQADVALHRLDTLHIFPKTAMQDQGAVSISGAVRRPGRYRLTTKMTLGDLLQLAGGPTDRAFRGQSSIMRRRLSSDYHYDVTLHPFQLQSVIDNKRESRILLKNQDKIVIREMQALQIEAEIAGMVQFPGKYTLPQGARITDLIAIAGGVIPEADLRAALFSRERIKLLQQQRLDHLFVHSKERFAKVRDLVTRDGRVNESVANHLHLLGLEHIEKNMEQFQASGRIVLNFTHPLFPESRDNLKLEDGDTLFVPKRMESVAVVGHVFSPNAFVWQEGKKIGEYLGQAGGPQEDADLSQTYAVLASGEVISAAQIGYSTLIERSLGPGDAILIPSRELGRSTTARIGDSLALVRRLVEIGVIGASIPSTADSSSVGLDFGTAPQPIPTAVGRPYDEILGDERIQADKEER